jgi:hypothetical protein
LVNGEWFVGYLEEDQFNIVVAQVYKPVRTCDLVSMFALINLDPSAGLSGLSAPGASKSTILLNTFKTSSAVRGLVDGKSTPRVRCHLV